MLLDHNTIVKDLSQLLIEIDLKVIKEKIFQINKSVDNVEILNQTDKDEALEINKDFLLKELTQISETHTLERTKYYIERLIKSLTEIKTSKINDINLYRWKEYDEIITDSLWIMDRRDSSGAHNAGYWGNFIPQIPHQFLLRYTKKDDWVLDTFLGSGTTLIECQRLGRNGVGIELQPSVSDLASRNIEKDRNLFSHENLLKIVTADSIKMDYSLLLSDLGINNFQFVIMHPPYWDIIKFSDDPNDLSNAKSKDEFLQNMGILAGKVYDVLEKKRYCAVVIGDKYNAGEWIPLGFLTMQEFLNKGFTLKSTIIKNFDETKGKKNQKELWRYRALVGGFYIFKHEYIFLFKK